METRRNKTQDNLNKELNEAAYQGKLEEVKALVQQGVDINAQDNEGNTALIMAVKNNNQKIVGDYYMLPIIAIS